MRPLKTLVQAMAARLHRSPGGADLAFVLPPAAAQGWVLDAIARELAARFGGWDILQVRDGQPLPEAQRYFFTHYAYFVAAAARSWRPHRAHSHVFVTHLEPEKHGITNARLAEALVHAAGVLCMNRALADTLHGLGVPRDKLHVVVGAADSAVYRPHRRTPDGAVGFCSAYYPRKSPDMVLEVARRLPHRRVLLLGKRWDQYPRFAELSALPNFEYIDAAYDSYPAHYARMSVFVSVSRLEGGPIPLLEAMMSNVVPVASRTGFAPDVVVPGRNGFLFDVDAPPEQVCRLVEQAFVLDADVSTTVRDCDWDGFAARVRSAIEGRAVPASAASPPALPKESAR
jgi:glycosyltransferase involved in cell wall biosynthesis